MPIQLTKVHTFKTRVWNPGFQVAGINLLEEDHTTSSIVLLDEFWVSADPFPPHPHAGFAAVTYVFPDSQGSLRSRDSLGDDVVIRPGGLAWTHAGRGIIHHEVTETPGQELHGLQLFVNSSRAFKDSPASLAWIQPEQVPTWVDASGNVARYLVGETETSASVIQPVEPFLFLNLDLVARYELKVPFDGEGMLYLRDGAVKVTSAEGSIALRRGDAQLLSGEGFLTLEPNRHANLIFLHGPQIKDRVVAAGPFILNSEQDVRQAIDRYKAHQFGYLAPL